MCELGGFDGLLRKTAILSLSLTRARTSVSHISHFSPLQKQSLLSFPLRGRSYRRCLRSHRLLLRWRRLLISCGGGGGGALKCGWNNTGERATPFLCMWGLRLGRNNQRHSLHTRVSVFLSFSFRLFRVLGCETLICPGIRLIHFFASFSTYNSATFLFLPYTKT